jgi:alanine-synthesizing transaminase
MVTTASVSGSKEGLAHLLLALIGPGDCVLSPDPCYPIHRYGVIIASVSGSKDC